MESQGYQSSDRKPHLCVLLGGLSGTEYLVSAVGLNQPAASKGVVLPGVTYDTSVKPNPSYTTIRYKTVVALLVLSSRLGWCSAFLNYMEGLPLDIVERAIEQAYAFFRFFIQFAKVLHNE